MFILHRKKRNPENIIFLYTFFFCLIIIIAITLEMVYEKAPDVRNKNSRSTYAHKQALA